MATNLRITILGLSITSSWGNGHATTYRHLVGALCDRGHRVLFLERDKPWYASNRDGHTPALCDTRLYSSLQELQEIYHTEIATSDLVIVGSYVPEGIAVGQWVLSIANGLTAFYDIDTPVTLRKLSLGHCDYLTPALIPRYDLYLSFTGGPTLRQLEQELGSPAARPLYCSVDPEVYFPEPYEAEYDLGYMGTYSDDRQPPLDRLLLEPARRWPGGRFIVAGPQYPHHIRWPGNVGRIEHLPPREHRRFYNSQRFTLNITRADMVQLGFSPSIRLFEAAACGTPIISDWWPGLDTFFELGHQLLISQSTEDTLHYLQDMSPRERDHLGQRARQRVLSEHTAQHRAIELEGYVDELTSLRTLFTPTPQPVVQRVL